MHAVMSQTLDMHVLLKDPKAALLPVLKTIHGWEQVNTTKWTVLVGAAQLRLCTHSKTDLNCRRQRTASVWHKFPEP